jgi:hypothetical protein
MHDHAHQRVEKLDKRAGFAYRGSVRPDRGWQSGDLGGIVFDESCVDYRDRAADGALARQRWGLGAPGFAATLLNRGGERIEHPAATDEHGGSALQRLHHTQTRESRLTFEAFEQHRERTTHTLTPTSLTPKRQNSPLCETLDSELQRSEKTRFAILKQVIERTP